MRTLQPSEIRAIPPQPAVMINHGEPAVPASLEFVIGEKSK